MCRQRMFAGGLSDQYIISSILYKPLFDSWMLFNNSGIIPTLIAKTNNDNIVVKDEGLFKKIFKEWSKI